MRDRQIRFEVLDDGYVASRAVSNVRTLLGEPVLAVVGACGTTTTAALQQADELTREGLLRALGGWQEAEVAPGVLPPVTFTEQDHLGLDSVFVVRMNGREFQTTARCSLDAASGGECAPVDGAGPAGDAG